MRQEEWEQQFATLVDLLRWRGEHEAERLAYTFLLDGEQVELSYTYGRLDREARAIAAQLQRYKAAGSPVLLLIPPGMSYIAAFFGCLYAGAIAIPTYPPNPARLSRTFSRLRAIIRDARPPVVLTTAQLLGIAQPLSAEEPSFESMRWLAVDMIDDEQADAWVRPEITHETLAFLQYTSGSTASPKGVMLSHANLLNNLALIYQRYGHSRESRGVIWLPPYHDMGLIGGVLQPLYGGFPVTLLSPVDFLQRPLRWLAAISRYRATTSGGPNFAYDLCVRKITPEQREGLDLSSWQVAFSGAEPIRAATLERFSEAFAPYGFHSQRFYLCYGLAEATLFVSGRPALPALPVRAFDAAALELHRVRDSSAQEARALVSCGGVAHDHHVAIVNPHSALPCAPDEVGEIWLAGPSVARGYWQRPEESAHTFGAQLAGDTSRSYLRTGDLGFLLGGELFITGRLKDLIIVRGRNHYPQDIELTCEQSHPALRPGCCAAFALEAAGEEQLVVVQEVDRQQRRLDAGQVASAIRQAVLEQHELRVHAVALIKHGSMPKTSSGKVQRQLCKARFLAGELELLNGDAPALLPGLEQTDSLAGTPGSREQYATASGQQADGPVSTLSRAQLLAAPEHKRRALLERLIQAQLALQLQLQPEQLGPQQPLSTLGLDSLAAVELQYAIETQLEVMVPMARLLEVASIAQLAEELLVKLAGETPGGQGLRLVPTTGETGETGEYQLSYGQQALWFLHQLDPQGTAYHIAGAVRIRRRLDPGLLRLAIEALLARHPSLRASFPLRGDAPIQAIRQDGAGSFHAEEAAGWSAEQLSERLRLEALRPFDLERGPLLRLLLLSPSDDEHIVLLVAHHIVADLWSLAIMLQELDLLYAAAERGHPAALPPPALQYRDYVAWQRSMLAGAEGQELWEYWQQKLGGALPLLNLPTDRPRPPVQTQRGGSRAIVLDASLTSALRELGARHGATLYMTLLGAFYTLLFRYSDQSDIVVGSVSTGRSRARLSSMVGYCANPLVLRADLSGNPSVEELLARVRQTVLEAFRHQDYPFALLVERLQPGRDLSRAPLFQVMFNFQQSLLLQDQGLAAFALRQPGARLSLETLPMEAIGLPDQAAQFDLTLEMAEAAGGLAGVCQYNSDLFDASTIERMLRDLQGLLETMVARPEQRLNSLALLPEDQRLLALWNETARRWPRERCLHQLFESQAERSPEAVALTCEGQQLSYAELNRRANQLARYLQKRGVGPETRIGVCVERSPEMLVGLLGILKAGGAYVPLDPAYPQERLAFMLRDSGAPVLLTQQRLIETLPHIDATLVSLDADWQRIAEEQSSPLEGTSDPDQLAYVIYTSGSTGNPKGVQIPHGAVVNFLRSMAEQPGLRHDDRLLSVTTLSFDIAGLELFLPLILGAQVVLASREVASDGVRLSQLIEQAGITMMQATPATWSMLIESGWGGSPALRMLCGGEALPPELARQLIGCGAELWNMYGPTETTIWSTTGLLRQGEEISIGRPIANTQVYLLSRALQQVPPGVVGELYIGGDGLSRGYLQRPALTAEKFLPDPFSAQPGARMYCTGDLARYRPDGTIECLGRVDYQVKVRGFRIELGEIEALLARAPGVRQCVVVAHSAPGGAGEQRLAAYLTSSQAQPPSVAELRALLKQQLPDYMIPSFFVTLAELPLTPNGKVDRKALPAPSALRPQLGADYIAPRSSLEQSIGRIWREVLKIEQIGIYDNFFDLGGHSLLLSQVYNRLRATLKRELSMIELFKYPTISALATYLGDPGAEQSPQQRGQRWAATRRERAQHASQEIAIVGMAGRFPQAHSIEEFWANLCQGLEAVSFFSDEQLQEAGVDPALLRNPRYVKARAVIEQPALFDAAFFGYTPKEAAIMDPQQRIFLECAWHALEHAGYDPERQQGRIGVYASAGLNTYLLNADRTMMGSAGQYQAFIGNDKDFLPTRVSYKLNLRGPSVNVQTACSSSLVAVHMACQSILRGECDMALAGGVALSTPHIAGYLYEEGGILSPDGRCRAFDAQAQGTVFGNGAGIVVLKQLDAALADGDTIYAVIKGSAINNDGSLKVGYTAPSVDGQAEVIAEALELAQVAPESISYVEAHGTGTALGDPIELAGLSQAFGGPAQRPGRCAIGSVKTNIGHLDTAAGIAGLIKTVLSLYHRQLPPSLHYQTPNPRIDFASSPFYVNTSLSDWTPPEGLPRRAGVSSFGIGGTNVHVVLEEAPVPARPTISGGEGLKASEISEETPVPQVAGEPRWQLLPLSARSVDALEHISDSLAEHLRDHRSDSPDGKPGDRAQPDLADVAYTLQLGRKAFAQRRILLCQDLPGAVAALETRDPLLLLSGSVAPEHQARPVAFLCSGQGSQYVGMARELYLHQPVFRQQLDACAQSLSPLLGRDLLALLYPPAHDRDAAAALLQQTALAQPALFAIEFALAQLWRHWGIRPQALLGHSLGELVAATLAGVFALPDALALVATRGRLMQAMPPGAMLSIALPEDALLQALRAHGDPSLGLAAVNGPRQCVVSGPSAAIAALEAQLSAQGHPCRLLHTSHAFHSAMMEPMLAEFEAAVAAVPRQAPTLPLVSNLTGTWLTAEQAQDPGYWAQQLRQPVRFDAGLRTLLEAPERVLLEIGPGTALSSFARQHSPSAVSLPSLPHPQESQTAAFTLRTAGRLWLAGVDLRWQAFHDDQQPRRIALPLYPFERQRYWIDAKPAVNEVERESSQPIEREELGSSRRRELDEWFYAPLWKQTLPALPAESPSQRWLLFVDSRDLGAALGRQLAQAGHSVIAVRPGASFQRIGEDEYTIDPARQADYAALIDQLHGEPWRPDQIVHCWSVTPPGQPPAELKTIDSSQEQGFYSLLYLAQALEKRQMADALTISIISNNMQKLAGEQLLYPEKATVLGPAKVIPQEYPGISCRSIDVVLPAPGTAGDQELHELLAAELLAPAVEPLIAYRDGNRWVQSYEQVMPQQVSGSARLRQGGVYLITGGLGGIGLVLAEYLARTARAKLVLVSRSALPEPGHWQDWLEKHPAGDQASLTIVRLRELETLGAELLVASADVGDYAQMRGVVEQARARFGALDGIIHAAGVAGGGIMQLKTAEAAGRVLAPKLKGSLVLLELAREFRPAFMLLCSSINAVAGGFGQGDYCAANAFMDAFAHSHSSRKGPAIIAVNWDRWSEVGMAVNADVPEVFKALQQGLPIDEAAHPLLGSALSQSAEKLVYQAELSVSRHWALSEHRILGSATLPGTTYLEMARAAFEAQTQAAAIELRDVVFIAPLVMGDAERREVITILERRGERYDFRVSSRSRRDAGWLEHARGSIGHAQASLAGRVDIAAIQARCAEASFAELISAESAEFIQTGPRWHSLRRVYMGSNEGLAELQLAEEFWGDCQALKLHPALLDLATGSIQRIGKGNFLPLAYERLTIRAALPAKIYSYVQFEAHGPGEQETLSCTISLCDEHGAELVAIQGFSMRRIGQAMAANLRELGRSAQALELPAEQPALLAIAGGNVHTQASAQLAEPPAFLAITNGGNGHARPEWPASSPASAQTTVSTTARPGAAQPASASVVGEGMLSSEGQRVFERILQGYHFPQVIVSLRPLQAVIEQARSFTTSHLLESMGLAQAPAILHPRPALNNPYAPPIDEQQRQIAEIWQRALGIERIGIYDNFFELGGSSLIGIQVIAELKQTLGVDIPTVSIFEAPTVEALARYLSPQRSSAAVLQQGRERAERKLNRKRGR